MNDVRAGCQQPQQQNTVQTIGSYPQQFASQQSNTVVTQGASPYVQVPNVQVPNFEGGQPMYYTLPPGASIIQGQGGQPIIVQMAYPQQINYVQAGLYNSQVYQQVFQPPLYQQTMLHTPGYQQPLQKQNFNLYNPNQQLLYNPNFVSKVGQQYGVNFPLTTENVNMHNQAFGNTVF